MTIDDKAAEVMKFLRRPKTTVSYDARSPQEASQIATKIYNACTTCTIVHSLSPQPDGSTLYHVTIFQHAPRSFKT